MSSVSSIPVHHYGTIDSTMEIARRLIESGQGEGPDAFWVRAEHQTAGRGRRERAWEESPGDALLATIAIRRGGPVDPGDPLPGTLALRFAAAVHQTLQRYVPERTVEIKWPNDILVEGRKISGVLLEADPRWFLAGIGINVRGAPGITGCDPAPTSLVASRSGSGAEIPDREELFDALQREVQRFLRGTGWNNVVEDALAWRGREVVVETGGEASRQGVVHGIARDGGLLLRGTSAAHTDRLAALYSGTVRLKGRR